MRWCIKNDKYEVCPKEHLIQASFTLVHFTKPSRLVFRCACSISYQTPFPQQCEIFTIIVSSKCRISIHVEIHLHIAFFMILVKQKKGVTWCGAQLGNKQACSNRKRSNRLSEKFILSNISQTQITHPPPPPPRIHTLIARFGKCTITGQCGKKRGQK